MSSLVNTKQLRRVGRGEYVLHDGKPKRGRPPKNGAALLPPGEHKARIGEVLIHQHIHASTTTEHEEEPNPIAALVQSAMETGMHMHKVQSMIDGGRRTPLHDVLDFMKGKGE